MLSGLFRDDAVATAELNEFILSRVCAQITPHRTNPNLVSPPITPDLSHTSLASHDTQPQDRTTPLLHHMTLILGIV